MRGNRLPKQWGIISYIDHAGYALRFQAETAQGIPSGWWMHKQPFRRAGQSRRRDRRSDGGGECLYRHSRRLDFDESAVLRRYEIRRGAPVKAHPFDVVVSARSLLWSANAGLRSCASAIEPRDPRGVGSRVDEYSSHVGMGCPNGGCFTEHVSAPWDIANISSADRKMGRANGDRDRDARTGSSSFRIREC